MVYPVVQLKRAAKARTMASPIGNDNNNNNNNEQE